MASAFYCDDTSPTLRRHGGQVSKQASSAATKVELNISLTFLCCCRRAQTETKRYTKDQIRDRVQFVDSLACWAGLRHQLNTGCNISNSTALPVKVQRSTGSWGEFLLQILPEKSFGPSLASRLVPVKSASASEWGIVLPSPIAIINNQARPCQGFAHDMRTRSFFLADSRTNINRRYSEPQSPGSRSIVLSICPCQFRSAHQQLYLDLVR